jgi:RimJ/RimL family protein N-acetyltransferase
MSALVWKGLSARLEGRVVVLEPLRPDHEDDLYEAAQDMDWTWMFVDAARSREAFHSYFEAALASAASGVEVPFATVDAETGDPIGSTRFLALRPEHRGLEIGWTWLRRSRWSSGANVEAKLLQLEHAFERHGCMRVEFKTDARNERSRRALAALPCRFEGVFRKHMLVGDERTRLRDSAYYSIVDDEWPDVKANLRRRLGR